MSYKKKIHPITVVMKGKISYIDQNHFLNQAVNMFFSAVKFMGFTPFCSQASNGQLTNYTLSHLKLVAA